MAKMKAVIAVNSKGEVAGSYESMSEAARINGFNASGISHALSKGYTYKKFRWILESEYRKLWFEGSTANLCYSIRDRSSERVRKRWANASAEDKMRWRNKMSESAKRRIREIPGVMESVRKAHCKPVLCITTGEVFESAADFARKHAAHPNVVTMAANRGYKVWGKWIVKYITKEEYEQRRNQGNN